MMISKSPLPMMNHGTRWFQTRLWTCQTYTRRLCMVRIGLALSHFILIYPQVLTSMDIDTAYNRQGTIYRAYTPYLGQI